MALPEEGMIFIYLGKNVFESRSIVTLFMPVPDDLGIKTTVSSPVFFVFVAVTLKFEADFRYISGFASASSDADGLNIVVSPFEGLYVYKSDPLNQLEVTFEVMANLFPLVRILPVIDLPPAFIVKEADMEEAEETAFFPF